MVTCAMSSTGYQLIGDRLTFLFNSSYQYCAYRSHIQDSRRGKDGWKEGREGGRKEGRNGGGGRNKPDKLSILKIDNVNLK